MLRECGHDVRPAPEALYDMTNDASLRRRVKFFNGAETDFNVELHLNAGGGTYSTTIYYPGSSGGFNLASDIEVMVDALLPWQSIGEQNQDYFNRNLHFLMATSAPSVIVEPCFKDDEEQAEWIDSGSFCLEYSAAVFLGIQRYCTAEQG